MSGISSTLSTVGHLFRWNDLVPTLRFVPLVVHKAEYMEWLRVQKFSKTYSFTSFIIAVHNIFGLRYRRKHLYYFGNNDLIQWSRTAD